MTNIPDDIADLLSWCRTAITENWDEDHEDTIALVARLDAILSPIADGPSEPVFRVLDVSTWHLTAAERQRLEDGELPGLAYTGEYGGIVSTGPYEAGERDDLPDCASDTLVAIMREAVRRHCSYVAFDVGGAALPDFPTFDDGGEG